MKDKTLHKLLREKSFYIIEADILRRTSHKKEDLNRAKKLFAKAAPLDERIGDASAEEGRIFKAAVNWDSAGNCYVNAEQYDKAIRVYEKLLKASRQYPPIVPKGLVERAQDQTDYCIEMLSTN